MTLDEDIVQRLETMSANPAPDLSWPTGCYGSAASILVFVGPSPGGSPSEPTPPPRNPSGGLALWNQAFSEPYDNSPGHWGGKYTYSIPVLVETILGVPLHKGSDRLYAFANFDWVQSPQEQKVPANRMQAGERDVIRVLLDCKPRIIVPLTKGAHKRLLTVLSNHRYQTSQVTCDAMVPISPGRFHRTLDVLKVDGRGVLATSVVIRSPQHPNRMLSKAHANACARAIRLAYEAVLEGRQRVEITTEQCTAPL